MTDINVSAYHSVALGASAARSQRLFVDANILINFDRIGRLHVLLDTNRLVAIAPEVFQEAAIRGQSSANPEVRASAARIASWISANESLGRLEQLPASNRALETGRGAGERSIAAENGSNGRSEPRSCSW